MSNIHTDEYDTAKQSNMKPVGDIGNYYGGLHATHDDGRHFWAVENYDGFLWQEITPELYAALMAFEKGNA